MYNEDLFSFLLEENIKHKYKIRKFKKEDFRICDDLAYKVYDNSFSLEQSFDDYTDGLVLVEEKNGIVGFAGISHNTVKDLIVDSSYREDGGSKLLIQALVKKLLKSGNKVCRAVICKRTLLNFIKPAVKRGFIKFRPLEIYGDEHDAARDGFGPVLIEITILKR